jgi:hypothetical protein
MPAVPALMWVAIVTRRSRLWSAPRLRGRPELSRTVTKTEEEQDDNTNALSDLP